MVENYLSPLYMKEIKWSLYQFTSLTKLCYLRNAFSFMQLYVKIQIES